MLFIENMIMQRQALSCISALIDLLNNRTHNNVSLQHYQ